MRRKGEKKEEGERVKKGVWERKRERDRRWWRGNEEKREGKVPFSMRKKGRKSIGGIEILGKNFFFEKEREGEGWGTKGKKV